MVILLRKKHVIVLILMGIASLLVTIGGLVNYFPTAMEVQASLKNSTIVIDAGHGGRDPGAIREGVSEKEINLDVAQRLEGFLKAKGKKVHMTRSTDTNLVDWKDNGSYQRASLFQRLQITKTKKPAILVSIHCNSANNKSYSGPQTFYQEGDVIGEKLAIGIQSEMIKVRSTKRQAITGDYYLLKNSNCPTVIIEIGFLSNHEDRNLLRDANFRQKIAEAIGKGIISNL